MQLQQGDLVSDVSIEFSASDDWWSFSQWPAGHVNGFVKQYSVANSPQVSIKDHMLKIEMAMGSHGNTENDMGFSAKRILG